MLNTKTLTTKTLNKINTNNAARKSGVTNLVSVKVAEAKQIITSGSFAPNAVSAKMGDLEQTMPQMEAAPAASMAFEAFAATPAKAEVKSRKGGISSVVAAKVAEAERIVTTGEVSNETAIKFAVPAQTEVNRVLDFGVNEGKRLIDCSEKYLRWAVSHLEVFGEDHRWVSLAAKQLLEARQQHKKAA